MFDIVDRWWQSVDPQKMQIIRREKVEDLLIRKGIIQDGKEMDSLMRGYKQANNEEGPRLLDT